MSTTRGGETVSAQIGTIGPIEGLSTGNFKMEDTPFNIKRASKKYLAPSIYSYPYWRLKSNIRFYKGVFCLFGHPLEVNLWGMEPGKFVATRFEIGWNPEIVREIKQTSINATLVWGY